MSGVIRRAVHAARDAAVVATGLVATVLSGSTGCRCDDAAQSRALIRANLLQHTIDTVARSEQRHPAALKQTADALDRWVQTDIERTTSNPTTYGNLVRRDVRRWQDHQPEYVNQAARILRGNPERITCNAIVLFY